MGHIQLRHLLREKFTTSELISFHTYVCQFSSIGSIGPKPESWLCSEFLISLSGDCPRSPSPSQLKLIFPSVESVRTSLEGYAAGGSLPHSQANYDKQPYLRQFLHQWRSERLGRTRAMPHIKTYTAFDSTHRAQWLLLTSANLSHSAWGKLEKAGSQLFCRSYELGVLLCLKDHPELDGGDGGRLPVPYDVELTRYGDGDEPFVWDRVYKQKDAWGRRGVDG